MHDMTGARWYSVSLLASMDQKWGKSFWTKYVKVKIFWARFRNAVFFKGQVNIEENVKFLMKMPEVYNQLLSLQVL